MKQDLQHADEIEKVKVLIIYDIEKSKATISGIKRLILELIYIATDLRSTAAFGACFFGSRWRNYNKQFTFNLWRGYERNAMKNSIHVELISPFRLEDIL